MTQGAQEGGNRPLAVVTGASSGIGFHLAGQFVTNGFDVVMCAEDDELAGAAENLRATGAGVTEVRADLATPEGVEELVQAVLGTGLTPDALALNAGVGVGGAFLETDLDAHLRLVGLNVMSTVYLAHRLLPSMVARGAGRVLVTASVAATMPGPYNATYAASKAFVQSFAEAVRYELKDSGVTVTSLQPGPTDTEFFERAGMEDSMVGKGKKDDPAKVAKKGFTALMKGKDHVVVGGKGKMQTATSRVLPEKGRSAMHGEMAKPRDGED
jgi:uncharacterized protein